MEGVIYFINSKRTIAYEVNGLEIRKVEYKKILLGDFYQCESRIFNQRISEKDLTSIRRDYLPCCEKDFNYVAIKAAIHGLNQVLPEEFQLSKGTLQIEI